MGGIILKIQNARIKMQNEKSKFKKEFIKRLVWFSINIVKFSEILKQERTPWSIINQLIRSTTSIGANVVEAKSSSSKREYIKYFEIALKSANETKYWLILIQEIKPKFIKEIQRFLTEANEISKIIGSSVLTLKNKR